jgi:UDP-N-acetylmuramoylalanine--D-glutamate ligase
MRFDELEHCRVGIIGTGREGRSVWRQFRRRFPDKPLSLFSETAVDEGFLQQLDPAQDTVVAGALDVGELAQFDVLVRSAGVSIYRDELVELRNRGVRFTTASSLWFAENPTAKTICVTGTLGKSTTAKLTAHLLTHAGVKAQLAGNIGKPMLDCDGEGVDWWVIELSSFQISDLEAKPDIAVLLNISEDHLDWHRGFDNYRADKLRLAGLARDGRIIANFADKVLNKSLMGAAGVTWFNVITEWMAGNDYVIRKIAIDDPPGVVYDQVSGPASLPGQHNMHNLAAALTVLDTLGLEVPDLHDALFSYAALPHRLQTIGFKSGVRYVDDSISTTPVSVKAALEAMGGSGVVLLLGGMDRGLDWSGFAESLAPQAPHAIITLPDNGPRIMATLEAAGVSPAGGMHAVKDLPEAVALAEKLAPDNGCILLSPGAPSFPHFRDFEDRGDKFRAYAGF